MDYKEKVIALLSSQELSKEQKEKLENIFPELKSKDERIRKTIYGWIYTQPSQFFDNGFSKEEMLAWLEKQQSKSALEAWRDMRFEVYQQASGNRHEPNYSDDTTKMFSLNDIDEIIDKISKQIHSNSEKVGMNEESRWTDEDEETMQHCCGAIAAADYYTMEDKEEMENWLVSLKQRIQVSFDHENVNIQQKDFVPKVEPTKGGEQ